MVTPILEARALAERASGERFKLIVDTVSGIADCDGATYKKDMKYLLTLAPELADTVTRLAEALSVAG